MITSLNIRSCLPRSNSQVKQMTINKLPIQLAALLFSLIISSAVTAGESNKNENKDYRSGHTVSDADITDRTGSDTEPVVEKQAAKPVLVQNKPISGADDFQQTEEQWHRRQQEAYRQHLLNRQRQMNANPALPPDVQSRRKEYLKHMEQRRELFNRMNEQRRQEAEQRREKLRRKIHQTRTSTAAAGNS